MKNTFLIDTNIIVYAYNSNVKYHEKAVEIINFIISSNINIIYSTPNVLIKSFELVKKYKIKKQNIFDINLVALMISNKINTIITLNTKDFDKIEEITTLNPF